MRVPGNYEFTTVLDTYTYPYTCPITINGPICSDSTVAAGPSKLYGTFTIGDTIPGTWDALQFPVSNIALHQFDCALSTTQCAEGTTKWYSGSFTMKRDSLTAFGVLSGERQIYLSGRFTQGLSGRFTQGKFVGKIGWYTYVFCCGASFYSGTFVATRRP